MRYSVRQLRRAPAFALAALLCLGIGIGATTAIYSVVNAILFQPLPFPESDRLVRLAENIPHVARGRPLLQRGLTVRSSPVGRWGSMASPNAFSMLVPMTRLTASAVAPQRFYAVVQRTQEIGIRMAIGAQRRHVLALVFRTGLVMTVVGIGMGLAGAVVGTRLLQGLLFGATPLDATTFAAVSPLFGLVSAFACYLPARRATRVDALVALRSE